MVVHQLVLTKHVMSVVNVMDGLCLGMVHLALPFVETIY